MRYFITCILILLTLNVLGQEKCACPTGTIAGSNIPPERTFALNGNTIGLCGNVGADSIYSEFVLFDCKTKEVIGEWDGTAYCTIKKNKDTLIVYDLENIAIGKDFKSGYVPFYSTLFYYKNNKISRLNYYHNGYRKYSAQEIHHVNTTYKNYKQSSNFDGTLQLARMLFWAYVSGSKEAEKHLKNIEAKWGPFDGAISEDWNSIIVMYEHYKEFEKKGLVKSNF